MSDPPADGYAELAPPPELAPWVECFWTRTGSDEGDGELRVLPDGCADVIVEVPLGP